MVRIACKEGGIEWGLIILPRETVDVNLYGISELMDELEKKVANVDKVIDEALSEAAIPILEEAKRTTAFIDRSGKLRKSLSVSKIKTKLSKGNKQKYKLIGSFNSDVYYARMVEFGHSPGGDRNNYTPAHPFLEPAFLHNQHNAEEIIENKLKEALK